MNNSMKAENNSSSGPENTTCQSKQQQNSNSMQLNASTSNKLQLHQKLLGGVDSVGTLNHATNPNYPGTELRMRRIKNQDWAFVSGSTVAKTHFSNQQPTSQKSLNSINPNCSLRRLTPSCNWNYSCGSLWRPIQLPIQS